MSMIWDRLKNRESAIAVVGLGYVGLPLAVHMSRKFRIIGYDIKENRVEQLRAGIDLTKEVEPEELAAAQIQFTANAEDLAGASVFIVTVPTPIDDAKRPNLFPLESSSETLAPFLTPGSVVIYESTVYPGVTEDICGAILEKHSGLKCGKDFFLGYSPERINPGDKAHSFDKITKVVSGQTPEILDLVARLYAEVVTAGIHRAPDIKTAEAAKVIENTQRDLNIALMNELAVLFDKLNIDTTAVLAAAGTKWNFLNFTPGLVGGHCIGVDPYYLTHLAQMLGHHPRVILAGRHINDYMPKFVAEQTIKHMVKAGNRIAGSKVLILGLTFKEDVPDMRNSKVFDVIKELKEYDIEILVHDPIMPAEDLAATGLELVTPQEGMGVDAILMAVRHKDFLAYTAEDLRGFSKENAVFIDVKSAFEPEEIQAQGMVYWRL